MPFTLFFRKVRFFTYTGGTVRAKPLGAKLFLEKFNHPKDFGLKYSAKLSFKTQILGLILAIFSIEMVNFYWSKHVFTFL